MYIVQCKVAVTPFSTICQCTVHALKISPIRSELGDTLFDLQ